MKTLKNYPKSKYCNLITLLFTIISPLFFIHATHAQSVADVEFKKAATSGLKQCYTQGAVGKEVTLSKFNYGTDVMTGKNTPVPLPNSYTSISSNQISCEDLIFGTGSSNFQGLISLSGRSTPMRFGGGSTAEDIDSFLKGMGYQSESATSGKTCVRFRYNYEKTGAYWGNGSYTSDTYYVCFDVSNGRLSNAKATIEPSFDGGNSAITFTERDGAIDISRAQPVNPKSTSVQFQTGDSWEDVKNNLLSGVSGVFSSDDGACYTTKSSARDLAMYTYCLTKFDTGSYMEEKNSDEIMDETYTISNPSTAYTSASAYLLNAISPTFSDEEKAILYQNYLKNYYKAEWVCTSNAEDLTVADAQGYNREIRLYDKSSGTFQACRVKANDTDKTANGLDESNTFGAEVSFDDIASALNNLTITSLTEEQAARITDGTVELTTSDDPDDGATKSADTCMSSGAGETLGWILCPVLSLLSDAAETLYNDYVEPALRVEPQLFSGENVEGGQSGTRYAWGIFQGIANTLFIILLLVVIFSQLTGVGIDNYGIKKILPKMIVMAVLVNLSYIICLICIDLSNILGNGIQSLFNSIEVTIPDNLQMGGVTIGSIGTTALTGVALLGILAISIWPVVQSGGGIAILLMLLVAAISIAVSIFFLFILLAAREAAIIVLTIISPLAFVCYMLPNTKKLYDKWFKAWGALLLLYPICGALVGGGNFVSKLLIASGAGQEGFFNAFMAMIIGIVPIFFIPTLLKNSMAALGGLGAKISGMGKSVGSRLSGNMDKTIRGTNRYQERQKEYQKRQLQNQEELAAGRATRVRKRLEARKNAGKQLGQRQLNKLGDANTTLLAYEKRQLQNQLAASDEDYNAQQAHQRVAFANEREKNFSELFTSYDRGDIQKELRAALAGNDAERASAALSTLVQQGGISEALNELSGANWNSMDGVVRNRIVQTMGNSGVDAMKSYSKYRSTGGQASFADWSSGNIDASQRASEAAAGVKDGTYAQHLMDGKEHAMDNYTKDEMQFVQSRANQLVNEMGKDKFGATIGSAAINNKDAKAQTVIDDTIKDQTGNGNIDASNLGWSSENLGAVRGETTEAIISGYLSHYANSNRVGVQNVLRNQLQTQINDAKADSRIYNRMNQRTKDNFGI